MSRRPDLSSILAQAGGSTRRARDEPAPASPPAHRAQPSRVGTKPITVHFPQAVRDQIKRLAIDEGTTSQELLGEALNDLFRKYGRPEIAPTGRGR